MHERPLSSALDREAATLSFSGVLDEPGVPAFGSAIADAFTEVDGTLVIDLSDVDYLPSVAVSALLAATRREDGRTSELLAAEGSIAQRVLYICGLPHRTVRPE